MNWMPACWRWLEGLCKVVSFLKGRDRTTLWSFSQPDFPGIVFIDMHLGVVPSIELMVHESAHLYFNIAESAAPLLAPNHSALYWSPLRKDPRPLRGIFLAFHALAFMGAAYREMLHCAWADQDVVMHELEGIRRSLRLTEPVLNAARGHLTHDGISFLTRTAEVCSYAYGD